MDIPYTGDADVDFVRGMIAHHQGAIDMATVVIEYGADPDIRSLAEGIVAAQEKEIAVSRNGWRRTTSDGGPASGGIEPPPPARWDARRC